MPVKLNFQTIVSRLFLFMSLVGNNKNMTGKEKKKWVMLKVKEELFLSEELQKMIDVLIDYVIEVDKGKIILNQKIKKKFFKLCC